MDKKISNKPSIKPKPLSPRQQSANTRDYAANKRKPAPYGRYEDGSPLPKPTTKGSKMAVRKPGPGSTQSEINAYIRQEVAKKMGVEGPKRSPMKKTATQSALAKVKPAMKEKLMEKAKKSKPKPRLY